MEKRYYETAKIKQLTIIRDEGVQPIEAYATLLVEKSPEEHYTLDCFLGGGSDAERVDKMGLKEGDSVLVELCLLQFRLSRQQKKEKDLKAIQNREYRIKGEIISISIVPKAPVPNYYDIVLNCGLCVGTNVTTAEPLKAGDYLSLEGRLDAHIIRKA